jgi:hypothetical protein
MPIHGVDVSRYQGLESLDGQSFVIVNVEDPGLLDKVAHAKQIGIPWGLYTWVYPGSGRTDMARAAAQVATVGDPPLGFWLDYEQAGVTPTDLGDALDHADEQGILGRTGVYTYLATVDDVAGHLRDRPLWLAYYPGNNDGSFPATQDGDAHNWNAVLWQYTSGANAPVGLDRNVVIDEAWYSQWLGGAPTGAGDDDMTPDQAKKLDALFDALVFDLAKPSAVTNVEWTRAYLGGIPGVFPDLAARIKDGIQVPAAAQLDAKDVAANIVGALGTDLAQKVADEIAARLKQP